MKMLSASERFGKEQCNPRIFDGFLGFLYRQGGEEPPCLALPDIIGINEFNAFFPEYLRALLFGKNG
ncbi:MAG: hypothetical protein NC432_02865 [Roseburia sp.]|nr:hypothetical protein [Roseburia sp.]MCM1097949.1 hypothetical protein [Ruminococcus flavefaciens]